MRYIPLVLAISACATQDPYYVPTPTPPPDTDLVEAMCLHLQRLGCEEGDPVYNDSLPGPEDVPNQDCSDFYRGLQGDGFPVNPRCVIAITRCSQIEDFRQKDPDQC